MGSFPTQNHEFSLTLLLSYNWTQSTQVSLGDGQPGPEKSKNNKHLKGPQKLFEKVEIISNYNRLEVVGQEDQGWPRGCGGWNSVAKVILGD